MIKSGGVVSTIVTPPQNIEVVSPDGGGAVLGLITPAGSRKRVTCPASRLEAKGQVPSAGRLVKRGGSVFPYSPVRRGIF
jgi:hypothetical protein